MKIILTILLLIVSYMIYGILCIYMGTTESLIWILLIFFTGITAILITPKEDTHEPIKIYESDTFDYQQERIEQTRIASQKRKARKLTK